MIVCMCTIVFGFLHMICVLIDARHTANAVEQLCKMVSHPKKFVLTCGCNCKVKGHNVVSRVWNHPVLCRMR